MGIEAYENIIQLAFINACAEKNLERVKILIKEGANVTLRYNDTKNCMYSHGYYFSLHNQHSLTDQYGLYYFFKHKWSEAIYLSIKYNPNLIFRIVSYAHDNINVYGYFSTLKDALEICAKDKEIKDSIMREDYSKELLRVAVILQWSRLIELLLELGVDAERDKEFLFSYVKTCDDNKIENILGKYVNKK